VLLQLTTATALPDTYHAGHATVYFNATSASEASSTPLSPSRFFVSSAMKDVVESFSKEERAQTQLAQYTVCALRDELPPHVRPLEFCSTCDVRPGTPIVVWGSNPEPLSGTIKLVLNGEIEFAPDPTVSVLCG